MIDYKIYFIIVFLFINEYQGTFQFEYHVLLSLVQVSQVVSGAQSLPRLNLGNHKIENQTLEGTGPSKALILCEMVLGCVVVGGSPFSFATLFCSIAYLLQTKRRWQREAKNGNKVGLRDRNGYRKDDGLSFL